MKRKIKRIASIIMVVVAVCTLSINAFATQAANKTAVIHEGPSFNVSVTYHTGDKTAAESSGVVTMHTFGGKDSYTREQPIITMLHIFELTK